MPNGAPQPLRHRFCQPAPTPGTRTSQKFGRCARRRSGPRCPPRGPPLFPPFPPSRGDCAWLCGSARRGLIIGCSFRWLCPPRPSIPAGPRSFDREASRPRSTYPPLPPFASRPMEPPRPSPTCRPVPPSRPRDPPRPSPTSRAVRPVLPSRPHVPSRFTSRPELPRLLSGCDAERLSRPRFQSHSGPARCGSRRRGQHCCVNRGRRSDCDPAHRGRRSDCDPAHRGCRHCIAQSHHVHQQSDHYSANRCIRRHAARSACHGARQDTGRCCDTPRGDGRHRGCRYTVRYRGCTYTFVI